MKLPAIILSALAILHFSCTRQPEDKLYKGFTDPPAEARPFVRWWWLGNRITEPEIKRQLGIIHDAGLGGIEINPIEVPPEADTANTRALQWLSPEWNRMVALASREAEKRGLITDLIVGSGWPFGGEFLREDEMIMRVIVHSISFKGGDRIIETPGTLLAKALKSQSRTESPGKSVKLLFADLVPVNLKDTSSVIDALPYLVGSRLSFTVPVGEYQLIYGFLQTGHREVTGGAPGAAGPVMDHYRKGITLAYLNRLKKISDDTGIPLNKLIRALFCDSIELAGANWTPGFDTTFFNTYGYSLDPYLPFIFYESYRGYPAENYDSGMKDELKRVRFDYNNLLVKLFLENFTETFRDFCTENGLLSRYQAYGTPFLMGMLEGNMITDIPESNNWIYSVDMDTDEWIWNQDHGYMIWNLYAASGGHLTGRKIISCEAMTNTRGVFKASLEEIKRHDDMNFITGINHTILHGYNYSPAEKGFPGWVRFGEYFSEKNTWWPYFSKWTDYNSRLSWIFQNSSPVKNIAIIGPTADIWSEKGLPRVPFHKEPWYCYRLWEPLSQSGSSCDYIEESIIINGETGGGRLRYGPMEYQAVILCNVRSIRPETAEALEKFVVDGGKVVFTDRLPERSLSLKNAVRNDSIVKNAMSRIIANYPERAFLLNGPGDPRSLLNWTSELLSKISIDRDVAINEPDRNVFQIRKVSGEKDIWFFVNSNMAKQAKIEAIFPCTGKTPWIWNPEDGGRKKFPHTGSPHRLTFELQPLQSLLIVFEDGDENEIKHDEELVITEEEIMSLDSPWHAEYSHCNGELFSRDLQSLSEFGTSDDPQLSGFAGTVKYSTEFKSDGEGRWLLLPETNRGISEVYLNGEHAGVNWYGRPLFRIEKFLKSGINRLEIKHTTVLSNYVRTLADNPAAMRWTKDYVNRPSGLDGQVKILK